MKNVWVARSTDLVLHVMCVRLEPSLQHGSIGLARYTLCSSSTACLLACLHPLMDTALQAMSPALLSENIDLISPMRQLVPG